MDDIYGDLENYNDVNAIDELRNENNELKVKVEKYQFDLTKLQQDYDELQAKFKQLETNYSSLLKTARAEVERKSTIITNLNQEKDSMVFNSLKNCDKSLLNIRKNLLRNGHNLSRTSKSSKAKEIDTKNNDAKAKEFDTKKLDVHRAKEEIRVSSIDTVNHNTDDADKSYKSKHLTDLFDKHGESKENTPYIRNKPLSIKDRRKSMPCLNEPKFGSDNDSDDRNSADESNKLKEERPRDDKRSSDKTKYKVSETSSIEDKFPSHHESSKESCHKKVKSRISNKKLDRIREMYESSRYRRKLSSERRKRDQPVDSHQRSNGKHRVLESPPDDRSYNHRRARDRRTNHNRPYGDRSISRQNNRATKHKLPAEDEPTTKRVRTVSSNRSAECIVHEDRPEHTNEERTRNTIGERPKNIQDERPNTPHEEKLRNTYERRKSEATHRQTECVMDEERPKHTNENRSKNTIGERPKNIQDERPNTPHEEKLRNTYERRKSEASHRKTECVMDEERPKHTNEDRSKNTIGERPKNIQDERPNTPHEEKLRNTYERRKSEASHRQTECVMGEERPKHTNEDRSKNTIGERPKNIQDEKPNTSHEEKSRNIYEKRKAEASHRQTECVMDEEILKKTLEERPKNTNEERPKNFHEEVPKSPHEERPRNIVEKKKTDSSHRQKECVMNEERSKNTDEERLKNTLGERLKNTNEERPNTPHEERPRNIYEKRKTDSSHRQTECIMVEERPKNAYEERPRNTHERRVKNTHEERSKAPHDERLTKKHEGSPKSTKVTEERVLDKRPKGASCQKQVLRKPPDPKIEKTVPSIIYENLQEDSCQSPDHISGENVHVPREIKLTATKNLEDPRLTSNKYKIESDNKIVSTSAGKDVDLKRIDLSTWNIPIVPKALQKPPQDSMKLMKELHQTSYCSDQLVKHVYVDIDIPVSNLSISMESGEILSDSNNSPAAVRNEIHFNDNARNSLEDQQENLQFGQDVVDQPAEFYVRNLNATSTPEPTYKTVNHENVTTEEQKSQSVANKDILKPDNPDITLAASYKIPKVNKTDSSQNKSTEDEIRDVLRESAKQCQSNAKELSILTNSSEFNDKSYNSSKDSQGNSKPKIILKLSDLKGYRKLSPIEVVAGDLELSDDTSDFIDVARRKSRDKHKAHKNKTKEPKTFQDTNNAFKLSEDPVIENGKKHKKKHNKTKGTKLKDFYEEKVETIDTDATPKTAQKSPAQDRNAQFSELFVDCSTLKDSSLTAQTTERPEVHDKIIDTDSKLKAARKSPEEKKAKFNELFGDSIGSLITPEDLGVMVETKEQTVHSYLPIFEDAQDPEDVHVPEVCKEPQTQKMSKNKCLENNKPNAEFIAHKMNNTKSVHTNEIVTELKDNVLDKARDDKVESIKAIYKNLFPGDDDTKDTEVLKTVILASGVQPRQTECHNTDMIDLNIDTNDLPQLPNLQATPLHASATSTPLHALATSTPYKPLSEMLYKTPMKPPIIVDEARLESSCNSSETGERPGSRSSVSTDQTLVSLTEDQPDVRIFVRRRKKIKRAV